VTLALLAPVLAGCGAFGVGTVQEPVADPGAKKVAADTTAGATSPAATPSAGPSTATPATRTTSAPVSRTATRTPVAARTTSRTTTKPPTSKKATPGKTTTSSGGGSSSSSAETEVLRLVNVERGKAGCKAVTSDSTLVKVARAHSRDMAEKDYFSHDGKDGRDPFKRMSDGGYRYSYAAENIAAGQGAAASVMKSWMNSSGHKANILNCKLTELGVGMWKDSGSTYGTYWTQDFGTPR
jgi:uncharacterized protein YkwD